MKLITKTIIYYLLISLPLLLIAGLFSFYIINKELKDGTDEALWKEKINCEKQISLFKEPQSFHLGLDSLSNIKPISSYQPQFKYIFIDTLIYDKYEEETLEYRLLKSVYSIKNQNYLITIAKPTLEKDDLMDSLFSTFTIILSFLLLAFFAVNWLLSKTLWKPFYKTLQNVSAYDLKNNSKVNFETSSIKEFKELNTTLNKMIEKIQSDYSQQKQFTENASHEMQTPLAIIKISLDNLFQSSNLKEEELIILQSIEASVNKLSQLNKSLLLLTKIENNQFKDVEEVSLNTLFVRLINDYKLIYETKNITVKTNFKQEKNLKINSTLVELLFGNLINNAFKHNIQNGTIELTIENNSFIISNTGNEFNFNPTDLFNRFKKDDSSKDSLGLGLAIVKSITDNYNFSIIYSFANSQHYFKIEFHNS